MGGRHHDDGAMGLELPAVTRHDLALIATRLSTDLRAAEMDLVDERTLATLKDCPRRIQLIQSQQLPYFYNGNGHVAVPAYIAAMDAMRNMLLPAAGWEVLTDNKAMPAGIARRLRYLRAALEQIVPDQDRLRQQIAEIQDAHSVAESLPVDLQNLSEARDRLSKIATDSAVSAQRANESSEATSSELKKITDLHGIATKLVDQCEEAYRITTTKGLAAAFDQRAIALNRSVWAWVLGLVGALAAGTYLGAGRIALLTGAMSDTDLRWGVIAMQLLLSVLSLGAPIWFAWMATKQIGQRFRLAEDYAFKASVAKAYEGYRKEAARLDDEFSSRLFGSALSRLEEAPLRLVEGTTHGSPWHEFFGSEPFQRAINTIPELKDSFLAMSKSGLSLLRPARKGDVANGAGEVAK